MSDGNAEDMDRLLNKLRNGYCPYCNAGPFVVVASHITAVHGVSREKLLEEFGLNRQARIVGEDHHARISKVTIEKFERNPLLKEQLLENSRKGVATLKREGRPKSRAQGRRSCSANILAHKEMYTEFLAIGTEISRALPRSDKQKQHHRRWNAIGREWLKNHPEERREFARKASEKAKETARSKLTIKEIDTIKTSPMSQRKIAREFGISRTHVKRIRNGWTPLNPELAPTRPLSP